MRVCKRKGCSDRVLGRGLCNRHYQRLRSRLIRAGAWDPRPKAFDKSTHLDLLCPMCGAKTFARDARDSHFGRGFFRVCGEGHSTVWMKNEAGRQVFVREALTIDDMRIDDCVDCGEPATKDSRCHRCAKRLVRSRRVYRDTHPCHCGKPTATTNQSYLTDAGRCVRRECPDRHRSYWQEDVYVRPIHRSSKTRGCEQ